MDDTIKRLMKELADLELANGLGSIGDQLERMSEQSYSTPEEAANDIFSAYEVHIMALKTTIYALKQKEVKKE